MMTKRMALPASPFMRVQEVLALVPVGRSKLYMMIAAGEFPAPKKFGARISAWSKEEVERWVAEKLSS